MEVYEELPLSFRIGRESDLSFILSSWLHSFRFARAVKNVSTTVYFHEQEKILKNLLLRATVEVATSVTDPDHLYGFIVYEPTKLFFIVHYVFVKKVYQGLGIGTRLVNEVRPKKEGVDAVHTYRTESGDRLLQKFTTTYNPYWGR